jgi:hypothetical protein
MTLHNYINIIPTTRNLPFHPYSHLYLDTVIYALHANYAKNFRHNLPIKLPESFNVLHLFLQKGEVNYCDKINEH